MQNNMLINVLLLAGGFGIYMALVQYSRKVQNRTFSTLTDETRQKIFEAFAPFRKYNLIPAAALLAVYVLLIYIKSEHVVALNIGFVSLYLLYLMGTLMFIRAKLIKLEVDPHVVFKILYGLSLQYLGMVLVMAVLLAYIMFKSITGAPDA